MRQRLLSVCLLFLFLFSSCAIQGEESDFSSLSSSLSSSDPSESSQDLQPSQDSNSESSENPNNEALVSFPFGYDQLTEEEKEVYDLLESNTVTPEQPVILDQSLTVRQANQICNLYQLNRTDYSWQGYQYYAVGTTYVKLLAVPRLDPVFNEQQMTDLFEQRVQWYLEQIPKDATDYEKVVQVATLLCQNVDYYDLAADFSLDTSTLTDPIKRLVQEAKH